MEKRSYQGSLRNQRENFINNKINKWTVISEAGWNNHGKKLYLVRCECGNESKKRIDCIKSSYDCVDCSKKRRTKYSYEPGQRVHNWTVINKTNLSGNKYLCRCKCGRELNIAAKALSKGVTTRCMACRKSKTNTTHGLSGTRIYRIWAGIKARCYNPNNKDYKNYGKKGVRVVDSWHNFEQFLEDMGESKAEMTIDRIDSNGNYCKENCRWLSKSENSKRRAKEYAHISKLCICCQNKFKINS